MCHKTMMEIVKVQLRGYGRIQILLCNERVPINVASGKGKFYTANAPHFLYTVLLCSGISHDVLWLVKLTFK